KPMLSAIPESADSASGPKWISTGRNVRKLSTPSGINGPDLKIEAAVDVDRLGRDVAAIVGGQEDNRSGNFVCTSQPLQQDILGRLAHSTRLEAGFGHFGSDKPGSKRVAPNLVLGSETGDHLTERNQPGLAGSVVGSPWPAVLA